MTVGAAMAFWMPVAVISLKRTRLTGRLLGGLMASSRCQLMASPSRSGSVASTSSEADLAAARSSRTTFSLAGLISYSSWKPFSMSTPSLRGRSRMWPTEAMTLKPLPRYLVMVLALEGLSTITSFRPRLVASLGSAALVASSFDFLLTGHSPGAKPPSLNTFFV